MRRNLIRLINAVLLFYSTAHAMNLDQFRLLRDQYVLRQLVSSLDNLAEAAKKLAKEKVIMEAQIAAKKSLEELEKTSGQITKDQKQLEDDIDTLKKSLDAKEKDITKLITYFTNAMTSLEIILTTFQKHRPDINKLEKEKNNLIAVGGDTKKIQEFIHALNGAEKKHAEILLFIDAKQGETFKLLDAINKFIASLSITKVLDDDYASLKNELAALFVETNQIVALLSSKTDKIELQSDFDKLTAKLTELQKLIDINKLKVINSKLDKIVQGKYQADFDKLFDYIKQMDFEDSFKKIQDKIKELELLKDYNERLAVIVQEAKMIPAKIAILQVAILAEDKADILAAIPDVKNVYKLLLDINKLAADAAANAIDMPNLVIEKSSLKDLVIKSIAKVKEAEELLKTL